MGFDWDDQDDLDEYNNWDEWNDCDGWDDKYDWDWWDYKQNIATLTGTTRLTMMVGVTGIT